MRKKPFFILIPIALFFGIGLLIVVLWNYVVPTLFGLSSITYVQALALFLLSRILFGSFNFRKRRPPFLEAQYKQKMMHMSEEERHHFKEEWKQRCKASKQDE